MVLATASGITELQVAYLLGRLNDEHADVLPVTVVEHVATLYEHLEYVVPNVEVVAKFVNPNEVLTAGGVTIASLEEPVGTRLDRHFEAIADDTGMTLVQLSDKVSTPTGAADCTVYTYTLSNHPPRQTIDEVVDTFAPHHVVITHRDGRAANHYKDRYDSDIWVTDDTDIYTLLDETGWTPP